MSGNTVSVKRGSIFARKNLVLSRPGSKKAQSPALSGNAAIQTYTCERRHDSPVDLPVLVVNSSHEMAKEITMQLTLSMPGCSIMYAPTLDLAAWILKRREIGLVVSSPVLPDGGISRLVPTLGALKNQPDLVVVGKVNMRSTAELGESGYSMAALRPLSCSEVVLDDRQQSLPEINDRHVRSSSYPKERHLKALGADIRNDLNNPLQEIVAMVFVAQAQGAVGNATKQALEAIDTAAQNMAEYVNGLEEKIRGAVAS